MTSSTTPGVVQLREDVAEGVGIYVWRRAGLGGDHRRRATIDLVQQATDACDIYE